MGQNKLDNQIKEKLNSREIQPSAQAWDRLDAMLTVAEEKKTKRSFGWLYIAAGAAVLLTAGMFFFSQNATEINPKNNVVGTEASKDSVQKEDQLETPVSNKIQENQVADSNPNTNQQSTNNNNQSVQNQNSIINQKTDQKTNQKQSINPLINGEKEIQNGSNSAVAVKEPKIIETKKESVSNSNSMTDEELLASLDHSAKQSNKQAVVKVDAKRLLSQVDGELEMTFREKAINKLNKNYKEIKLALANRNKE
jgi:hypothetical protein